MNQKIKYCTQCGKNLREGAKFCSSCGAKVPLRGTEANVQETAPMKEQVSSSSEQVAREDMTSPQPKQAEREAPIGTSDPQPKSTPSTKKSGKMKIIAALVLIAAILAASLTGVYMTADARAEQKYEAHMEAGQQYLQEQKYTEAVAEFTEALEIKDDVVKPYQLMAQAYIGLEDDASVHQTYTAARSVITVAYEEAGTLLDDAKETYMEAIVYYYEMELPDVAVELAEEIVEMLPEDEINDVLCILEEYTEEEEVAEEVVDESTEALLQGKLAELVAEYGLFNEEQSGTMTFDWDSWMDPIGIMGASILDFDSDGELELLVCVSEEVECDGFTKGEMMLYMWEVSEDTVVLADEMQFAEYTSDITSIENGRRCISMNVQSTDNGYVIWCEEHESSHNYWDSADEVWVWSLEYRDGKFQKLYQYCEGAYFEISTKVYENNEVVETVCYYNDWGEDALYDDAEEAEAALYADCSVEFDWSYFTNSFSESVFAEQENFSSIFLFQNIETDYSMNSVTYEVTVSQYATLIRDNSLFTAIQ